jgi:hypothetical protein
LVGVDEAAQHPPFAEDVLLPHELVEGAWTHARSQRRFSLAAGAGAFVEHIGTVGTRTPRAHSISLNPIVRQGNADA